MNQVFGMDPHRCMAQASLSTGSRSHLLRAQWWTAYTGAWPRPASRPVPGLTFSVHNGRSRTSLCSATPVHGPGQPLDRFPVSPSPCTLVALGHPWPSRHRCIPAQWSLLAIPGLRDTGASLHNGIEPPTRGFSVRNVKLLGFINQRVTGASDALDCSTVHNRAELIHAKLTQRALYLR